jgi:thiamine pyrophosphate-dependent acetolactate synthase large subunit-like protein
VKHVAIVPVADVDSATRRALRYAATLTPRVVALNVANASTGRLAEAWTEDVPLVVLEGQSGSSEVLLQAIQTLKRAERAERISVVVPARARGEDFPRVLGPGVVVCPVPATVTGL